MRELVDFINLFEREGTSRQIQQTNIYLLDKRADKTLRAAGKTVFLAYQFGWPL